MTTFQNVSQTKGLLIILVVFGHCFPLISRQDITVNTIWTFIYNFHMPLFFMISGMLYYNSYLHKGIKIRSFLKGKFNGLMVPYLTVSVFSYLLIFILSHISIFKNLLIRAGYDTDFLLLDVVYSILTNVNHVDQHLWFVYSLFIIFILFSLMDTLISNNLIKLAIVILISLADFWFIGEGILRKVISFSLYFYLGRYMLSFWDSVIKSSLKVKIISMAIPFLLNILLTYLLISKTGSLFFKELLHYGVAVLSLPAILSLISLLSVANRIDKPLKSLGENSFIIYLLHQPFLVSGLAGFAFIKGLNILIISPLITIIGIIVPLLLSRFLIENSKILSYFLTGKKKIRNNDKYNLKHELVASSANKKL